VGLFWYLYRDQNIDLLISGLNKVDYYWIVLSVLIYILSHLIRALRWRILVKPLGYSPSLANSFFSVMSTYLANYALPRLGEVTRPTIIKKYENIPFPQTFGTIVTERIIDLLVLFILTFIVIITQFPIISQFLSENPETSNKMMFIGKLLLVFFFASVALIIVFWKFFRKKLQSNFLYKKIADLTKKFLEGLKTVFKLDQNFLFIFYSLLIWALYYFGLYVSFLAFDFTKDINLVNTMTVFVIGSYGMVAPSQGGLGTWHIMTSKALVIIGIAGATISLQNQNAEFFALVHHGAQTLMVLLVGSISIILLPVVNRKNKKNAKS
jgi:glycosyltransferase 2 family protein